MSLRVTKIIAGACTAFTMSLTIGCGDLPESPAGANLPVGAETSAQTYPAMNFNLDLPQVNDRTTIEYIVDDGPEIQAIEEIDGPADWPRLEAEDQLEEGFADGITAGEPPVDNQGDEVEDEAEEQAEPMDNGFADGDATVREWKEVASTVCRDEDSELTGFKVTNEADSELYRATRFACTEIDESNESARTIDYAAFVLGDDTSCKTLDAYKAHAAAICGTESELVEKKVFDLCGDSGDVSMYRSALFVCKKPQK